MLSFYYFVDVLADKRIRYVSQAANVTGYEQVGWRNKMQSVQGRRSAQHPSLANKKKQCRCRFEWPSYPVVLP